MLRFDCMGAKGQAREWIRSVKPSPMLVTLIFLVLTNGISLCVGELTTNPFQNSLDYLLEGYDPAEVFAHTFSGTGAMLSIFLSVLVTFYTALLYYGYSGYVLRISRGEQGGYENLLEGFGLAVKVVLLDMLTSLLIVFWSMFFLIPGIIASYRYSQAVFCLLDDPEISPVEALRRSKRMMQGHKMELFAVQLSFFGWILLRTLVSNGMAFAWGSAFGQGFLATAAAYVLSDVVSLILLPYMQFTFAQYYNHLTGYHAQQTENGPEILF